LNHNHTWYIAVIYNTELRSEHGGWPFTLSQHPIIVPGIPLIYRHHTIWRNRIRTLLVASLKGTCVRELCTTFVRISGDSPQCALFLCHVMVRSHSYSRNTCTFELVLFPHPHQTPTSTCCGISIQASRPLFLGLPFQDRSPSQCR
jgi:hypothetical protein